MTVLVGAIDKKTNQAYLATDRQISYGDHTSNAPCIKIIDYDFMAIACCGTLRGINVLETFLQPPMPMPEENMYHYCITRLVPAIQEAMKDAKYSETSLDGGMHSMQNGLLLIIDGKLFQIGSDYSVQEFFDFACDGSGMMYACGAMYVCDQYDMPMEDKLAYAVEAASAFNQACGGGMCITKKGKLNWVGLQQAVSEVPAPKAKSKTKVKTKSKSKSKVKKDVDNDAGNDTSSKTNRRKSRKTTE